MNHTQKLVLVLVPGPVLYMYLSLYLLLGLVLVLVLVLILVTIRRIFSKKDHKHGLWTIEEDSNNLLMLVGTCLYLLALICTY